MTQPIIIVRGNDTNWNGLDFLTITLTTEILNLSNFTATFTANGIVKTFDNLSSGQIKVNFTASETQSMPSSFFGVLRLFDSTKRVATIESLIPFKVIDTVHGDAIATEPYTLNFDVTQGGETILTVNVEAGVSVKVGTTTTLSAGSDATVINSGTDNHLILDFGIPKGNGIASIEKTGTSGLVDTYTITYETGDTDTFELTNGNGIKGIAKTSTSGLVDTYTITFDNNDTEAFTVTNGSSIASILKTSTSGLVDTYTVTLTNGDTSTFTVTNGKDGINGTDGFSPTATVTKSDDTATITIIDKDGTTTATVKDGTDGTNATITGATASITNTVGTPSVTVISGGTESARSFHFDFSNLKGETGATGQTGADGFSPIANVVTENGVTTFTITDKNGTTTSSFEIINTVLSTSTSNALSANMGKELQDQITHLQGIGRFLSLWDASTGLAETNPPVSPYTYKTGDYFIVGVVGSTNYKPTGSSYTTGTASTVIETETIDVGNVYYYDGSTWKLQAGGGGGTITDVQVNSTSVVTSGVANIPKASANDYGVIKIGTGLQIQSNGQVYLVKATEAAIIAKTNNVNPIVPDTIDIAVREGLGNNGLNWSEQYKTNACRTIGAERASTITTLLSNDSITLANNTIYNGAEISAFAIVLPSSYDVTFLAEIDFTSGTTATTITYPNTIKWLGDEVDNNVFTPIPNKRYTVIIYYNGSNFVGVVKGVE